MGAVFLITVKMNLKRSNYKFDKYAMGVKFKVSNVHVCDGGGEKQTIQIPPRPENCQKSSPDQTLISQKGRGKADFMAYLHAPNQEMN